MLIATPSASKIPATNIKKCRFIITKDQKVNGISATSGEILNTLFKLPVFNQHILKERVKQKGQTRLNFPSLTISDLYRPGFIGCRSDFIHRSFRNLMLK
ncbi:MAG: hypothetical protein JSR51_10950 [Proteobacteria bacterium]|nr:hypothetical protein [Pseudomonadota bacterium]